MIINNEFNQLGTRFRQWLQIVQSSKLFFLNGYLYLGFPENFVFWGGGIDWGGVAVRAAGAGFLGEWPVSGGGETHCLKHTTTLFALCDHDILGREWRVVVDQVQTNYHGKPNGTIISQV